MLEDVLGQEETFTAYQFSYMTDGKRMTGQLNLPLDATDSSKVKFPVIMMIRGFVPLEIYQTGVGTRNAAARFASNGFITIAPDFLGYGESDPPDPDSIGARLEKPRQLLDLIASLPQLSFIDMYRMGIWAHSNGGQIALSLLQITGDAYPTTLWAPVSKSFPYSILYYTDESDDQGKALRKVVAEFEKQYDVFDFSIDRYWDWITAPVQVHQGTGDDAIPVEWSNELVSTLEDQDLEVKYYTYPAADHDLRPVWETVINHDLDFFGEYLHASRSAQLEEPRPEKTEEVGGLSD